MNLATEQSGGNCHSFEAATRYFEPGEFIVLSTALQRPSDVHNHYTSVSRLRLERKRGAKKWQVGITHVNGCSVSRRTNSRGACVYNKVFSCRFYRFEITQNLAVNSPRIPPTSRHRSRNLLTLVTRDLPSWLSFWSDTSTSHGGVFQGEFKSSNR